MAFLDDHSSSPEVLSAPVTGSYVPGEVIVKYRAGTLTARRAALRASLGARAKRDLSLITAELLDIGSTSVEAVVERLKSDPSVEYAEPNYRVHAFTVPDDSLFAQQWPLHNVTDTDIDAPEAWDFTTGSSEILVGIIDTGIDYTHPDLAANIWTNPGEIPGNQIDDDRNGYVDDVHGFNFSETTAGITHDPIDDHFHGTHVAGTIGAVGNNRIGVSGINWRCRLVAIKFLDRNGSGSNADAIAAIQYSIRIGVRVTNNSWGGDVRSQAMEDAIRAAGQAGQLFVAAAGNEGVDIDRFPVYPASYPLTNIIAVAATTRSDSMAVFSNYGPTTVGIGAPGFSVLSTNLGGGYRLLSGTSMATPHVVGAIALLYSRYPDMDPMIARDFLLRSAEPVPSMAHRVSSGGRLNLRRMLEFVDAGVDTIPPAPITDLEIVEMRSTSAALKWTASGDDGMTGLARRYDLRYSRSPLTEANFTAASRAPVILTPQTPGSLEHLDLAGLDYNSTYWFAIRAVDEYGRPGPISNTPSARTLGVPRLEVSAQAINVSLPPGGSEEHTWTLRNQGEGILEYHLDPLQVAPDSGVTWVGGPDRFGYHWTDNEHGGPRFDWVDITTVGTPVLSTNLGSDSIAIGMEFPFYGKTYTTLRMSDHGYLYLGREPVFYPRGPRAIPVVDSLPPAIFPLWGRFFYYRFNPVPPVYRFVHNDGTRFIATWQWANADANGFMGTFTFQAILYPDGEIRFQYLTHYSQAEGGFTVGLQDARGRDALQIVNNAPYVHPRMCVQLKPVPAWLKTGTTSGFLAAGQSAIVHLTAMAANLPGGSYQGVLPITCNDPAPVTHGLEARLQVTGAPRIETPAVRDLGALSATAERTVPVTVRNSGQADLMVTRVSASSDITIDDALPIRIPPMRSHNLHARVRVTSPGGWNGSLAITSNDPDRTSSNVPLVANVLASPHVDVDLRPVMMNTGSVPRDTQRIVVRNTGTGFLRYEARPLMGAGSSPGARAIPGYTWRISGTPGGPKFEWIDITQRSDPVRFLYSQAHSCRHRIPFPFPFFGEEYDALDIGFYGYVSLRPVSCDPTEAPTAAWVNGSAISDALIASFWDDQVPDPNGGIWYDATEERVVITYANRIKQYGRGGAEYNPRLIDVGPWTHQIILYPSGRVVLQYLWMYPSTTSGSVGMSGVGGSAWVAHNQPFVRDRMAIEFIPAKPVMTPEPSDGSIPPGGSQEVTLVLDAQGLPAGVYPSTLQIRSDDPNQPQVDIPIVLNAGVRGVVSPARAAIDFGTVYTGSARQETLRVTNQGSGLLRIEDVRVEGAGVSLISAPVPVALASRLAIDLVVRYAPESPCASCTGTLEVVSNDPDHPTLSIPLAGRSVPPPVIEMAEQPVRAALAPSLGPRAAISRQTVVVRNPSPTALTLRAGLAPERSSPVAIPEARLAGMRDSRAAAPARSGGESGYRWKDSDAPLGPAFEWQEITLIGSQLPITGDDAMSEPVAIGFSFPFFGSTVTRFRVSTNGFITFTDTDNWVLNHPLPNEYAAADMVAPLWDNLSFGDQRKAYVYADGERCIVSWIGVSDDKGKGSRTFQLILEPSGRIVAQYLTINGQGSSATVGIQNATKDQAVTVAFNHPGLHDGLAIEIAKPPRWVRSLMSEVTVPGNGESRIELELDATGLAEGSYTAALDLSTSDPNRPEVSRQIELHVGAVTAELTLGKPATNANSRQKWMEARIEPPAGMSPQEIALASVRLMDDVGILDGAPVAFSDADHDGLTELVARFDRLALLAALPDGESVPVTASAEIPGSAWLSATTTLRVRRPQVTASGAALGETPLTPGAMVHLRWDDPLAASQYELWFSADDGSTWSQQAEGLRSRSHPWRVPRAQTADGRLELVALDADGLELGSWISPALQVGSVTGLGDPLPIAFGIRMMGANPARSARFELAVPRPSRVQLQLYDVRGARVRTVLDCAVEPGWRAIEWDGRSDAGALVASGVYFATMFAEGQRFTQRLVIMR